MPSYFSKYISLVSPFHSNGLFFSFVYLYLILVLFYGLAYSTGYRPSGEDESRWNSLLVNGDETKYEIWETKFLGHMPLNGDETDTEENKEIYADLIQFLGNKSPVPYTMREASDKGREILKIL